jgi:hypothetical protein
MPNAHPPQPPAKPAPPPKPPSSKDPQEAKFEAHAVPPNWQEPKPQPPIGQYPENMPPVFNEIVDQRPPEEREPKQVQGVAPPTKRPAP